MLDVKNTFAFGNISPVQFIHKEVLNIIIFTSYKKIIPKYKHVKWNQLFLAYTGFHPTYIKCYIPPVI